MARKQKRRLLAAASVVTGIVFGAIGTAALGALTATLLCARALTKRRQSPTQKAASPEHTPAPEGPDKAEQEDKVQETPSGLATETEPAPIREDAPHGPVAATDEPDSAGEPVSQKEDITTTSGEGAAEPEDALDVPEKEDSPTATEQDAGDGGREMSPATPAKDSSPTRTFSFRKFQRRLTQKEEPLAELEKLVRSIRKREKRDGSEALLPVERYLARILEEAGLFEDDEDDTQEKLPQVRIVMLSHSRTFYIHPLTKAISYRSHLRLMRIEAALNALLFAHERLGDLNRAREEEAFYRINQRLLAGVSSLAPSFDTADWTYLAMPWQSPFAPAEHGEWAIRNGIAEVFESLRLPHRLIASFRANVSEGDVAIEFTATPSAVFPRSAYVSALGIVPTTSAMRNREAALYVARITLLLGAHAFKTSPSLARVWISAISRDPATRSCLCSVCLERRAFSRLNLTHAHDPIQTLEGLGASIEYDGERLMSTEPLFYLEDERFCPIFRHDLWNLSERTLSTRAATALGTNRVSGLMIHEELPRARAAEAMLRGIAAPDEEGATQKSVHAIMSVANTTSDLSVWSAAERLSRRLVEGSIALDDYEALREEIVEGDELTRTTHRAEKLLQRQTPQDAAEALSLLQDSLRPLDETGTYEDTDSVCYRYFESFSERVLYNRLNTQDRRSVVLVPDSYVMAHLMAARIHITFAENMEDEDPRRQGHIASAIAHAHRTVEVAPTSISSLIGYATCLDQGGDLEGAKEQLCRLLSVAHYPQAISIAYRQLAHLLFEMGDTQGCQACYLRAMFAAPQIAPLILAEAQILSTIGIDLGDQIDSDAVERALIERDIPLAPTQSTAYFIFDGATAAVDAEVFPVARSLMSTLVSLTGDDVFRAIRSSLDREPDA